MATMVCHFRNNSVLRIWGMPPFCSQEVWWVSEICLICERSSDNGKMACSRWLSGTSLLITLEVGKYVTHADLRKLSFKVNLAWVTECHASETVWLLYVIFFVLISTSLVQSVGYIAGTPLAPYVADGFGRRNAILVGATLMIAAAALQTTSHSIGMFIGARYYLDQCPYHDRPDVSMQVLDWFWVYLCGVCGTIARHRDRLSIPAWTTYICLQQFLVRLIFCLADMCSEPHSGIWGASCKFTNNVLWMSH